MNSKSTVLGFEDDNALSAPRIHRCPSESDQRSQCGKHYWSIFGYESIARLESVRKCLRILEPTIGLEPMTCRLRIDCSTN